MTPDEVEAIRERVEAATPGPWTATAMYPHLVLQDADEYHVVSANLAGQPEADARFIAHARADVPALLAALAEAQRERDDLVLAVKARDIAVREADRLRAEAQRREELMRPVLGPLRAWREAARHVPGPLHPVAADLAAAWDTYETQTGGTE